jgi:putative glutathione S-transferase
MAQFPKEEGNDGSFERQPDEFRNWPEAPEAGRYHLYVCKACPWAHRTWLTLRLMGLEESISVNFVDPVRDERGWRFREGDGHGLDEIEGFRFLSEAYLATKPDFEGRFTVPVLWDKKKKRIVNNSEDDICKMWADVFKPLAAHPVDLFPVDLVNEQEALSAFIYDAINNGVYEAGFASSQSAYEKGFQKLFDALEGVETRLVESGGPFLFGERLVETDYRLFCTLVRFDAVYFGHFKCNKRAIKDYPALQVYLERIYSQPGVAETVNFDHIKRHYYYTHNDINPTRIVPVGPVLDWAKSS